MNNAYADIGAFTRRFTAGQQLDETDQLQALVTLLAASRGIDNYTRRTFYAETATRLFHGSGAPALEINEDIISVGSLAVDTDGDRVYETELVEGTDYELANIDDEEDDQPPYGIIRLLPNGSLSRFPRHRRAVQLTGRWGYSENLEPVLTSAGVAVTGTLSDDSTTTLTTSGAGFPEIAPGMTLRIGNEDVYIRSGLVSPFVVDRGVNGTTAAPSTAVALSKYVYEADVVEATLIQTGRLWQRRNTPLLPALISAPNMGDMQLATGLDPDVQLLLRRVAKLRSF